MATDNKKVPSVVNVCYPKKSVVAVFNSRSSNTSAPTLEKYLYEITQRSFAPWARFGDLFGINNIWIRDKRFVGDDRGFSLENGSTRRDIEKVTARIHQITKIKTNQDGILENNQFASETRGYPSLGLLVDKPKEDIAFSNVKSEASFQKNNLRMHVWGSDPLVFPAPDIEWELFVKFKIGYIDGVKTLELTCEVNGRGFPAYESFIEDNNGNRVFLFTVPAPARNNLAKELINPLYDADYENTIRLPIDDFGNFIGKITVSNMNMEKSTFSMGIAYHPKRWLDTTIEKWNRFNLDKKPAPDCMKGECGL